MRAYFDMSLTNIRRYNSVEKNEFKHSVCLIDDPEHYNEQTEFQISVCTSFMSIKELILIFKELQIKTIVISGQRIPDYRITIAANFANVEVKYRMHGLYIPHMKRNARFYILNLMKSIRYLYYLSDIAREIKSFLTPLLMFFNFVFGLPRSTFIRRSSELHFSLAEVWSDYWKAWHIEHFAMTYSPRWIITGNPDYKKFLISNAPKRTVVYIYQTLVEDGRINKTIMMDFYKKLKDWSEINQVNVWIKFHPRGSKSIRHMLSNFGFNITDELYCNTVYVGHYSSLLGLAPLLESTIMIIELPKHATPYAIRKIANTVTSINEYPHNPSFEKLQNKHPKTKEAKYYFGEIGGSDESD